MEGANGADSGSGTLARRGVGGGSVGSGELVYGDIEGEALKGGLDDVESGESRRGSEMCRRRRLRRCERTSSFAVWRLVRRKRSLSRG